LDKVTLGGVVKEQMSALTSQLGDFSAEELEQLRHELKRFLELSNR